MADKQVEISYDPLNKIVYIDAHKNDFIPRYLEYLFEYLGIPKNAPIMFLKDQPKKQKEESDGTDT